MISLRGLAGLALALVAFARAARRRGSSRSGPSSRSRRCARRRATRPRASGRRTARRTGSSGGSPTSAAASPTTSASSSTTRTRSTRSSGTATARARLEVARSTATTSCRRRAARARCRPHAHSSPKPRLDRLVYEDAELAVPARRAPMSSRAVRPALRLAARSAALRRAARPALRGAARSQSSSTMFVVGVGHGPARARLPERALSAGEGAPRRRNPYPERPLATARDASSPCRSPSCPRRRPTSRSGFSGSPAWRSRSGSSASATGGSTASSRSGRRCSATSASRISRRSSACSPRSSGGTATGRSSGARARNRGRRQVLPLAARRLAARNRPRAGRGSSRPVAARLALLVAPVRTARRVLPHARDVSRHSTRTATRPFGLLTQLGVVGRRAPGLRRSARCSSADPHLATRELRARDRRSTRALADRLARLLRARGGSARDRAAAAIGGLVSASRDLGASELRESRPTQSGVSAACSSSSPWCSSLRPGAKDTASRNVSHSLHRPATAQSTERRLSQYAQNSGTSSQGGAVSAHPAGPRVRTEIDRDRSDLRATQCLNERLSPR